MSGAEKLSLKEFWGDGNLFPALSGTPLVKPELAWGVQVRSLKGLLRRMSNFTTGSKVATILASPHDFRHAGDWRLSLYPRQVGFGGLTVSSASSPESLEMKWFDFSLRCSLLHVHCLIGQCCNCTDCIKLHVCACAWEFSFFVKKAYLIFLLHASGITFPSHLSLMDFCTICVLY